MRKRFQMNFVRMLYNKNRPSYSNPSGEKRECSREAKIGTARPTLTGCMRQFKVALQSNRLQLQLPNYGNMCCEYLLANKCQKKNCFVFRLDAN